jgi:excisionase family DNA binding protein
LRFFAIQRFSGCISRAVLKPKPEVRWRESSKGEAPEMLTAKELEAMLKINVKTIYSYVHRGLIPYVKIQSNVRFPKQEILSWIEEQSHRPRLAGVNGSTRQ